MDFRDVISARSESDTRASLERIFGVALLRCLLLALADLLRQRRGDGLAVELLQHLDRRPHLLRQQEGARVVRESLRGVEVAKRVDRPLHAVPRRRHLAEG